MNRNEYRKSIVETRKANKRALNDTEFADSPGWARARFVPAPFKVPLPQIDYPEFVRNTRIATLNSRLRRHIGDRGRNARVRIELLRLTQYTGTKRQLALSELHITFGGGTADEAAATYGLKEA